MNTHRIHRVAKLTGLSKDVIRVWERRYGLVTPDRGPNRYRIYTDEDVALLRYLRGEVEKGQTIGELANLGREELIRRMRSAVVPGDVVESPLEHLMEELIRSLSPLDPVSFERRLNGAVAVIPFEEALHGILLPLERRVGEMWHQGRIDVGVEHYVTKQVQQKLFTAMNQIRSSESAQKVVVGCPPRELHEIGAQSVTYLCRRHGWRVHYLGPDIPVSSLAAACTEIGADLVLLSFVMVQDHAELILLIRDLSTIIRPISPIWVGGTAAVGMRSLFEQNEIRVVESLRELEERMIRISGKKAF